MLTETQFKALLLLFDDVGHAGWQLAEKLGMAESNLNPLLKKLERRNFIFQGLPRKSNRPKRSERIDKREGDYKEFPYYLNKDLLTLGIIIKEMVVTNRFYDTGFPFRIIETSKYMKSMRNIFKEDYNKSLAGLEREHMIKVRACTMASEIKPIISENELKNLKELHFLSFKEETPPIKERRVSKKLLEEIEVWWLRYNLTMCCSQDPIDIEKAFRILHDPALYDYLWGEDILEVIQNELDKPLAPISSDKIR